MGGVAGCFGLVDDPGLVRRMRAAQRHRGPDGEGCFTHGPVGLAHSRLAVLDREHGAQPLTDASGRYVICCDGAVHNHGELRDELRGLGHTFRSGCDTEVLVEAFAEWREAAFDRFDGMFGLAVYDTVEQRLFLARDHFGIKPLYVACLPDGTGCPRVLFASEIKALLGSGEVEPVVDERVLYRYLRFGVHDDGADTFFAGVQRVLPGEVLTIDDRGVRRRTSDLPARLGSLPRRRYTSRDGDEYAEQLRRSVRERLISDVPVGTRLSGSLGSSTVVLLVDELLRQDPAARAVGARQHTVSAVLPGSRSDEERCVEAVLTRTEGRAVGHTVRPSADAFAEDLRDFVLTQEEPTLSTGPYVQYTVAQAAAEHVTVLLDGSGADELLAGSPSYRLVHLRQLLRQRRLLRLGVEAARSRRQLWQLLRPRLSARLRGRHRVDPVTLLDDGFLAAHASERFSPVSDDLRARLLQDLFEASLPALLRCSDKNTARFGLEGRTPFLDVAAVSHLFSLDDEAVLADSAGSRVLRDATDDLLPDVVRTRPDRTGSTTREEQWFERLKTRFYEVFCSASFGRRPYFDQAAVLAEFERFVRGRGAADTALFWRLLNTELWLRAFIDEEPADVGAAVAEAEDKPDLTPNEGKSLDIEVGGHRRRRYPVQTRAITADDDLAALARERVAEFFARLRESPEHREWLGCEWSLVVCEKVVAITQGRSFFVWDIAPGRWARFLSRRVAHTPHGIGLGSPETMQLAIQEAGLPRILFAALVGAAAKALGRHGDFYRLAGSHVAAIDGPTEYSVYPSNVSAKLPPARPDEVAARLAEAVRTVLPADVASRFRGVVVIDANDLGCQVLGSDRPDQAARMPAVFADNPLGQDRERTPLCVVFDVPAGGHSRS
ncbi:asparagine synthase (glutamine-hydrolyzing) [Geodermatophilus sp. TF02-6]|uniref:asparagine synthase (glutamine-hydrolyzing) n=1 Tax=Geodermatophilus sp. TF02-6 TaxID=2250575 RepID=UPI000DE90E84|nr:asparagine synthase (glutamine-hydrolyzing) [Geodermatophilus sp. TF02-6]RBY78125.1 asparagine synthase (glutamine-hydrolyzing) [Geodermatophilus sp. TF02-6]